MIKLSRSAKRLVVHWGEMGSRWGVNRTVAQIHALLYVSHQPLHAAEIAETLAVARSNVSNSLRELQAWGIVKVTHTLGDRRDYFESVTDIWELFRVILEERWRREIEPTLSVLETCLDESDNDDAHTRGRLRELLAFFRSLEMWYQQLMRLRPSQMKRIARMGGKVRRLLFP